MNNEQVGIIAAAILHSGLVPEGEPDATEVIKTAREFTSWLDKVVKVSEVVGKQILCQSHIGAQTNWDLLCDTSDPLYVKCESCGRWVQPLGDGGKASVYMLPTHERLDSLTDTSQEYWPQKPS